MGFLNISTPLLTWLAAETLLADGKFLQVAVNRETFLKLRGRTRLKIISKSAGSNFNLSKQK